MKKLTLHLLLIALVMVSTFAAQSAQTPRPPSAPTAAPLDSANKQKKSFEFTCETTEDEFYDWITKAIWKKPPFGRNLDGDDGPGIAKEAERVFEAFYRSRNDLIEGVSGTGLGLSIARALAEAQNGSLRLVSRERGACFQLQLPLATS